MGAAALALSDRVPCTPGHRHRPALLHPVRHTLAPPPPPCCAVSANESTGAICPGTSKPRGCPNTPCTTRQLRKVLFSSTALGGSATGDTVGRGFEKVASGWKVSGQCAWQLSKNASALLLHALAFGGSGTACLLDRVQDISACSHHLS